jgi:predicted nucleotidyltransferase
MDFRHPLTVVTPTLDGDVLAVLAGADEEFSGRHIHQLLRRGSENGVRNAAERLVEQGVVVSRRAGQANLYRLNRAHLAAPYVEGLAGLRAQLVDRLRSTTADWSVAPRSVLLFGSVARAEAGPSSDLDLLVIRRSQVEEDDDRWRKQLALLEDIATALTGNEAQVIEYGEGELEHHGVRGVVEEALKEGIELYGSRLSVRRLLGKTAT